MNSNLENGAFVLKGVNGDKGNVDDESLIKHFALKSTNSILQ